MSSLKISEEELKAMLYQGFLSVADEFKGTIPIAGAVEKADSGISFKKQPLEHDMAENGVYIGDNLQWLTDSRLRKFLKKIKVIYIDPPYNTKTQKSYSDKMSSADWLVQVSKTIAEGREYLACNGIMFISIDDNEYAYLKVECDKIFGKENFVGTFIVYQAQRSNAKFMNTVHEYVICYARDKKNLKPLKIRRMSIPCERQMILDLCSAVKHAFENSGRQSAQTLLNAQIRQITAEKKISWLKNYSSIDSDGNIFFAMDLSTPGNPRSVNIESINLKLDPLPSRAWSSDEKFIRLHKAGLLAFKNGRPYEKHFLIDAEDNVPSILNFYSRQGTHDLEHLGLSGIFDTPKPVAMIKYLIRLVAAQNDIVMDFYAGSGTTAQAVMELNMEEKLSLSFVLVQRSECLNNKTLAYKKSLQFGINPDVADILIARINAFLLKNNYTENYSIYHEES